MTDVTCCEKCCKPLDDHPLIDVSNVKVLQMCDRHPKWQRVEPGTVIPAGQPYRVEYENTANWMTGCEYLKEHADVIAGWKPWNEDEYRLGSLETAWFIDSSWKPPLVLPTEPTWGIAHVKPYRDSDKTRLETGRCEVTGRYLRINGAAYSREPEFLLDFIPLTDEQVARIEAAR